VDYTTRAERGRIGGERSTAPRSRPLRTTPLLNVDVATVGATSTFLFPLQKRSGTQMPITAYPDVCHRGEVRNGSGGRASNARSPPERPRSPLSYRGRPDCAATRARIARLRLRSLRSFTHAQQQIQVRVQYAAAASLPPMPNRPSFQRRSSASSGLPQAEGRCPAATYVLTTIPCKSRPGQIAWAALQFPPRHGSDAQEGLSHEGYRATGTGLRLFTR
jgi:hypothetical protein